MLGKPAGPFPLGLLPVGLASFAVPGAASDAGGVRDVDDVDEDGAGSTDGGRKR